MAAHQRIIREQLAVTEPRPAAPSLAGYSIAAISRAEALPLILRYEWLGTLGRATFFAGLLSSKGELEGAVCFGYGPSGPIRQLISEPALCLERGACVHYAPANAASFLINGACRLACRSLGVERFFAYADPNAGEYGGVYQAAGWVYLGQGLDNGKVRARRRFVLRPGDDPARPENWVTTRALRRATKMNYEQARARGWQVEWRPAKHVYATHVGESMCETINGRRIDVWRQSFPPRPYPKPDR